MLSRLSGFGPEPPEAIVRQVVRVPYPEGFLAKHEEDRILEKIGLAFRSTLTADEVREKYITPLRAAFEETRAGIYSNYLRQVGADAVAPTEHLLVFEVHDFKQGLRLLRTKIEQLGPPDEMQFQNLNPSSPGY